jgi:hypothetical protein
MEPRHDPFRTWVRGKDDPVACPAPSEPSGGTDEATPAPQARRGANGSFWSRNPPRQWWPPDKP